ncbi:sensor domain-containing diguanylate cyclase [Bacillus marasmi]|uniref:sensor domain-containing diguanylate cyclase n=1 Tax=Bacillus marasmi TaxID=1926279 RepID=UPI0011CC4DAD|nr:PAS domain S-box protein [Bacillus marasmi]
MMKQVMENSLFMNTFNFSAIGMAIVSMDGKWLKVNSSLCKILGYSETEIEQKTFQEVIYLADIELHIKNNEKLLTDEIKYYEITNRFIHKSGKIVWGILTVRLEKDENNQPLYYISQIQDVTEQKELKDKLKESNNRYRNLIQYSPEPMALYCEGKLTYINEEGRKSLGANSVRELIGRNIEDFIHPDYKDIVFRRIERMIKTNKQLKPYEMKFIRLTGEEIDVRISSNPINQHGKKEVLVIFSNITQRKNMEKELQKSNEIIKESEERYRTLVESSANGIVLHQEGKIIYANPSFIKMVKAESEDKIIGQPIINFVHPDYHQIVNERIQTLNRNLRVGAIEEKYIRLDGKVIDVEVIAAPVEYMDKPAFQVVIHDITKRKEMERKLINSQEQYRSVVENVKEVIFQTDDHGNLTFLNPAWTRITGYQVNESIGNHVFQKVYQLDREEINQHFQSLINGETEYFGKEIRYKTKAGRYCWVEMFARVVINDQGEIVGTLGTLNDITTRKESEAESITNNERFQLLAEYSSDMLSMHDIDGKYLYASPACKEILQYHPEELVGNDAFLYIHPNDRDMITMDNAYVMLNGYNVSTYRIRRKDGEYVWLESATKLLNEIHTGEQKLIVVSRNITERKLTEQKLQKANEILKHLSTIDGLTSVSNRRAFDERLEIEWNRAMRTSRPLSLIMFDIDYFKAYNDTYGHQGGDGCLKQIASTIEETIGRSTDFICRYGGEEFCAILPETNKDGAKIVAEKIRVAVESLKIPHSGSKIQPWVSISVGTATMIPSQYTSLLNLISNADKAVYQAKHLGRNCVCSYQ